LPSAGAQQPDGIVEPSLLGMQQTQIVQTIEVGFMDREGRAIELFGFAQPALPVKR
jgi:hypothetical protein